MPLAWFTATRAFPARTPVPGENKPWECKTGRVRTQPPRGSRTGSCARDLRTRVGSSMALSAPRSNRSPPSRRRLPTRPALSQQQQPSGVGEHRIPSSRDLVDSSPSGADPWPSMTVNSVDPRLLQRSPDLDLDHYQPISPPSTMGYNLLPWTTGSTRPAGSAEPNLLPGPAPGPAETRNDDSDGARALWEFLIFDCDEDGGEEGGI